MNALQRQFSFYFEDICISRLEWIWNPLAANNVFGLTTWTTRTLINWWFITTGIWSKKSFWIVAARQNGVPDLIRGDYECSSTFDDILIAWNWIFWCYCCEDKVLFSVDTWKELQVAVSSMTQKTLCWKDDSHISLPSKLLSSSCEEPYGPALIIIWWIKASHLCLKSQLMVVSINYLQMPLAAYQHSWKKHHAPQSPTGHLDGIYRLQFEKLT